MENKQRYADCIIKNQENKFLILLRSRQDDFEPGKWCLPGGKIEPLEDPNDAAIREVDEETGIKLNSVQLNTIKETESSIIFIFDSFIDHQELNKEIFVLDNDEHINYAWIKPEEIEEYDFLLDLKETLRFVLGINKTPINLNYIKKSFDENEIDIDTFCKKWIELSKKPKEDDVVIDTIEKGVYKDNSLNDNLKRVGKEYVGKKKAKYKSHEYHDREPYFNQEQESFMDKNGDVLDSDKSHEYFDSKIKHDKYRRDAHELQYYKSLKNKQFDIYQKAKRMQGTSEKNDKSLEDIYNDLTKEKLGEGYFTSNEEYLKKIFSELK